MARILVIDDSPFIFKMVNRALANTSHEVVGHARNGEEGLRMIRELNPDIITLDITMPVMDGIQTLKSLSENGIDVKIIMMSAMGDDDLINEAKKFGVKRFISKPFKPDILVETIDNILKD
ncbi:MAG TPA: response regulator [Thermotogaceae bacterium]|nr:response regulator [Thermotogaceae bacterium]